jgi:hypothetical protein
MKGDKTLRNSRVFTQTSDPRPRPAAAGRARSRLFFVSPLKLKSRLEAENAALPTSARHIAAEGARPCPAHGW